MSGDEKKIRNPVWTVVVLAVFIFAGMRIVRSIESDTPQYSVERNGEYQAPQKNDYFVMSRSKSELQELLRNIVYLKSLEVNDGEIEIAFQLASGETEQAVKDRLKSEVADLLKVTQRTEIPYTGVTIHANSSMVDKFGNAELTKIAIVRYRRDTVDMINFANFSSQNVFDISDDYWLHSAFE